MHAIPDLRKDGTASASDFAFADPVIRIRLGVINTRPLTFPEANLVRADFDRDDGNFEQMPMHVELDAEGVLQSLEVLKVVNLHAEKQGMEARLHC